MSSRNATKALAPRDGSREMHLTLYTYILWLFLDRERARSTLVCQQQRKLPFCRERERRERASAAITADVVFLLA